MIFNITNQCHMNCSHCMMNATPEGIHMTDEIFEASIIRAKKWDPLIILVSGGEPTDHPNFEKYIHRIKRSVLSDPHRVIVLSNGLFTKDKSRMKEYMKLNVQWQIVNDPAYYPTKVEDVHLDNVHYFNDLPSPIFPAGRALTNNLGIRTKNPKCFNFRNVVNKYDFYNSIKFMESMGRFCGPMIMPDGSIILGENISCKAIGTINDSDEVLRQNVLNMQCNVCKLYNNLDVNVRQLVNEKGE